MRLEEHVRIESADQAGKPHVQGKPIVFRDRPDEIVPRLEVDDVSQLHHDE